MEYPTLTLPGSTCGRRAQALLRHVRQRMVPASLTQIRHTLLKPLMGQHLLHLRPRRRRAALALPQRAPQCSSAQCQQRTHESDPC